MSGKIYVVENTVNGKVYVGQTIRPMKKRFAVHKVSTNQAPLGRAMRKYGEEAFRLHVFDGVPQRWLNTMEIAMITKLKSMTSEGYNLSPGGSGNSAGLSELTKEKLRKVNIGRKHSKESIEKMRIAAKNRPKRSGYKWTTEQRARLSRACIGRAVWNKGIPMSESAKRKASGVLKGREPTRARPMFCVETGEAFLMIRDAANKYGLNTSNIISACTGKLQTSGGRHWKYLEEDL